MCALSDNIYDYPTVSQGKLTIPNVDDGEELELTDGGKIDRLLITDPSLLDHSFSHTLKEKLTSFVIVLYGMTLQTP
jgi:hypothetical protein